MIQTDERSMTRCTYSYCCPVNVLSAPLGIHTNKSTFLVCFMNQMDRQTISRISQPYSKLRPRWSVRHTHVNQSHQTIITISQSCRSQSVLYVQSVSQSVNQSIYRSQPTTLVSPSLALELSTSPSLLIEPSIQSTLAYN